MAKQEIKKEVEAEVDFFADDNEVDSGLVVDTDIKNEMKAEQMKIDAKIEVIQNLVDASKIEQTLSKKEAETKYIRNHTRALVEQCKKDKMITYTGNLLYKSILGSPYTYLLNCVPVQLYFDGKQHQLPETVYNNAMAKLDEITRATIPEEVDERIN